MERKSFDAAELKVSGDGNGFLTGYASVFTNFDAVNERVVKGAFADTLPEFLKSGFVAVGHDWNALPIATPVEAAEDDYGLHVVAEFHSTQAAQDARRVIKERLERGKTAKFSIGYQVLDSENTKDGRLLKALKLYEFSYVTVPANNLAAVTSAKAEGIDLPYTEHSERVVSALEEFVARTKDREAFRAKEGRTLSEANIRRMQSMMERMRAVMDEMDGMMQSAMPAPKSVDPTLIEQLFREQLAIQAQINGVLRHG